MSISYDTINNYTDWKRVGKGKVFQFLVMDEDVLNWLKNLPTEYLPYRVLFYYPIKFEKIYEWKMLYLSLEEYILDIQKYKDRPTIWIASEKITDFKKLENLTPENVDSIANLSGFLSVQHNFAYLDKFLNGKTKHPQTTSSISMINKIRNDLTNETIVNKEYLKFFNKVIKICQKDLKYSVYRKDSDGNLIEDTSFSLMSENAFFQSTKGFINFTCMPGNLLASKKN